MTTTPTIDPERINRLLDWLEASLKGTQDFALEQAPLVAREIVSWTFWSGVVWCLGITVFMAACIAVSVKCGRAAKRMKAHEASRKDYPFTQSDAWQGMVVICIVTAVIGTIGLPFLAVNASNVVKSCVAPRLVIIDYIRGAK